MICSLTKSLAIITKSLVIIDLSQTSGGHFQDYRKSCGCTSSGLPEIQTT